MSLAVCLAGGGVKGAAHIGVLKAIEEENLEYDYITGTSSGSIVASLNAMGYNSDEIYKLFKKYSKKIRCIDFKNVMKFLVGVIVKGTIIIDGLNSGEVIEKVITEAAKEKEKEEEIKDNEPEEQEEEIEEEENQKDDSIKKEEIAKKYNVDARQVVRLNIKGEKINEDDTFQRAVKYAKGYEEVCVIPGKDIHSWTILGRKKGEKEFNEIEQANKQVHGKNPDVTIKTIKNDKIVEQKPLATYDIDGENIMAIVKNEWGEPETLYCRKQDGEQKYWGTTVPELSNKNVRQLGFDERSFMSEKNTSGMDLAKKEDELDKAQDLNDRGVPSKEEGVQVYEIDGNARQNAETRKEEVVKDLMRRDGIVDKLTVPPGYYENKASKVLALLEQNEDMQYEEAIDKVEGSDQREERWNDSRR